MDANEVLRLLTALTGESSRGPHCALPEKVLIRTVTHYHVGRVVSVDSDWIVLDEAAWVASTGRFSTALDKGTLEEVEPFVGRVWVARGSVVDLTEWSGALPREAK